MRIDARSGTRRPAAQPRRRRTLAATALGRVRFAGCLLAGLLSAASGEAQTRSSIELDGTLPGTTAEVLTGPDYEIPSSKGALSGPNLFFSFLRFGLDTGESATFSGPSSVARILGRVTGGEVSAIDGRLRSTISGASFYLINPNGIVMGENATLDLSGAFRATTADFLELGAGSEFHARFPERDSPLSMAPVSAFGFLSADPASIQIDGSQLDSTSALVVGPLRYILAGHDVSLIGGDIEVRGGSNANEPAFIFTGGGRLDIASLDSPGRVRILNADPGVPGSVDALEITPEGASPLALGDVTVADGASLVTGGPSPIQSPLDFVNGSGDVFIAANDFTIENATVRSTTTSQRQAGKIDIDLTGDFVADGLGLNQTTGLLAGSGLSIEFQDASVETPIRQRFTRGFAEGVAEVAELRDSQGQLVRLEFIGQGQGGDIEVDARNVSILGGAKLSSSGVFGGDGGSIRVTADDTVTIAGARRDGVVGGLFSNALAGGNSGTLAVDARSLVLDDFGGLFSEISEGDGVAGSIEVDVERLRIDGSGRIDTTTRGTGAGGTIDITAGERVQLSGRSDDFRFSSITTFSLEEATGRAGTIRIDSPEITLEAGAGISTSALGEGDAGVIDLRADVIELSASSITSSADQGTGGDIYINAGPLAPGSLVIQKAPGVGAGDRLVLDKSEISTSATAGAGGGGDVVIDPEFVILRDSRIIAQAVGGVGGNIVIVTDHLVADASAVINADSQFNTNGNVEISTSAQELRGDVETLPATIPDVVDLLRERCAARRSGGAAASFVLRGRDGLPLSPEHYLPAFHSIPRAAPTDSSSLALVAIEDEDVPVELILGCRVAEG